MSKDPNDLSEDNKANMMAMDALLDLYEAVPSHDTKVALALEIADLLVKIRKDNQDN